MKTRNAVDRWSWHNARKRPAMYMRGGNPKRILQYFTRSRRTMGPDLTV